MYEIVHHQKRGCKMIFAVPGERFAAGIVTVLNRLASRYGYDDGWDYVRYGQGW